MKPETLRCGGGRLALRTSSEPFIQVTTDFSELQDIHLAMTCSLDAINFQYKCRLLSTLSKSVKNLTTRDTKKAEVPGDEKGIKDVMKSVVSSLSKYVLISSQLSI